MAALRAAIIPPGWEAFAAAHNYTPAMRCGDLLFCSGVTGNGPLGPTPKDPEAQFRRALDQLTDFLTAGGASWADLVDLVCYFTYGRETHAIFRRVLGDYVISPPPAWTSIGVASLSSPETLIEIKAVARIPSDSPEPSPR